MSSTSRSIGRLGLAFDYHAPRAADDAAGRMRARLGRLHGRFVAAAVAHRRLYALDKRLPHTLHALAPGWGAGDLHGLCARTDNALLTFDDSWTAVGWSAWWAGTRAANRAIDVVILHADDHKDVTSPFLMPAGEAWVDLLTGAPMSLRDPRSVADAVTSGAIGIGSFIAPWLHTWRRIELRHLRAGAPDVERAALLPTRDCVDPDAPAAATDAPAASAQAAAAAAGTSAAVPPPRRESNAPAAADGGASASATAICRPTITMRPLDDASASSAPAERVEVSAAATCESIYLGTDDLDRWTADIPADAAVLLHVDLDYFNDRHGGGRPATRPEPSAFDSLIRVRQLCQALAARGLPARIEHTAICCSPGFCPSECWEPLLWHLREGLGRIGCPTI